MSFIKANDFAPIDGKMHVYFKKVLGKKSDGFAIVIDGDVYVVDSGLADDTAMIEYLTALRREWLSLQSDASLIDSENAKLVISFFISHCHSDHVLAVPNIIKSPLFSVEKIYAPERSCRADNVEEPNPILTRCENRVDNMGADLVKYGHTSGEVVKVPFGKPIRLDIAGGAVLDVYPAEFDWSETRNSDVEGWEYLKRTASPEDELNLQYTNSIMNCNSLWVKATHRGQSVLITGDQRDSPLVLDRMIKYYGEENFKCDVLKYVHHGEGRYSPYLMEATAPKITVMTASRGNEDEQGCKHAETLSEVYYVCDGDLVLTFDGETITPTGIKSRTL